MALETALFFTGFIGVIAIFLLKLYNLFTLGKVYAKPLAGFSLVILLICHMIVFIITTLYSIDTLLYAFMFDISRVFMIFAFIITFGEMFVIPMFTKNNQSFSDRIRTRTSR